MKKRLLFSLTAYLCVSCVFAQKFTEWKDPLVNEINRMPMHSSYFAYENRQLAEVNNRNSSSNFLSLNGMWRFQWVRHLPERPTDFFRTNFDDKGWDLLEVPAMWEMKGYGDPLYVNQRYEWDYLIKPVPPALPEEENHVGSYRRWIEIPDGWQGKEVILHFGAVASNVYLWVNGQFVGYGEDSKLESEFNVTPYLRKGKNLVAFQVFRWSDGRYVESQDFWRFSGVSRDVYMYARNKQHITDYKVQALLSENNRDGQFNINATLANPGSGTVNLELIAPDGTTVWQQSQPARREVSATANLSAVQPWSAETPNLYQLYITLNNNRGETVECIPQRVGFKRVEVQGSRLLVNGKPILIKGVNRHEVDPDGGFYVSRERMEQDVRLMKEYNINSVRTSHYPTDPYLYELCDKYGIYVLDEANVEAHGYEKIADMKEWMNTHTERTTRMVERDKNVPSIIIWSMGNESGDGMNFVESYKRMKQIDNTRPVQYQRAEKRDHTDIFCPFYVDYEFLKTYGESQEKLPLIQCEYAHAMGNTMGGFKEYWDLYRKYDNLQGGYIWDFVDQGIRDYRNGRMIYAYGGDFGHLLPSDNNFNCNGLLSPDRNPNPQMHEVRMIHQSIWTTPVNLEKGEINIFNENFFINLDNVYLEWSLCEEGTLLKQGTVQNLNIEPQATEALSLGYSIEENGKEHFLEVNYKLKNRESLLPAGYIVARQQLEIHPYNWEIAETIADGNLSLRETRYAVEVSTDYHLIRFEKSNGFLNNYTFKGQELIADGHYLKPNFWRAPTDNDFGAGFQRKFKVWREPQMKLESFVATQKQDKVEVAASYTLAEPAATLQINYLINAVGDIEVEQKLLAGTVATDNELYLPRFGMQVTMVPGFENIVYYGRGPGENYADRKTNTFINRYTQTVDEQFYPYVRPQENGNKTDLRWYRLTHQNGRGFEIVSPAPFSSTALHFTTADLDDGDRKGQNHSGALIPRATTTLSIDMAQMGLGCIDSWWSWPRKEYMLPYQDYTFRFTLNSIDK